MITNIKGLYIHIPFCKKKCNYCDFRSFPCGSVDWREEYINALCDEIESYGERGFRLDSIFFGGGTPSLLTPGEIDRIFTSIRKSFDILSDAEISVEMNPGASDSDTIATFVRNGVNRVSIGLQSIHENELKKLGRIHNYQEFLDTYRRVRECGVDNLNVDLMYGIPEQTIDSFSKTLDSVIKLSPEHLSLYGLIVEDGTPFGANASKLELPGEDTECDMYALACDKMARAGYLHYEISNYSKEGYECKHNLKYWRCDDYIGVGLSAHSYLLGERYSNSSDAREYLSFGCKDSTSVGKEERAYEYVMLGLRLSSGISLSDYKDLFDRDFLIGREDLIDSLINSGYVILSADRLRLTERGFYVSNSILNELI